jgi:hypothetical protein
VAAAEGQRDHPAGEARHGDRREPAPGRAVAQLAVAVVAPALDAAALDDRAAVAVARGDGGDAAAQAEDVDRRPAVDQRSVA